MKLLTICAQFHSDTNSALQVFRQRDKYEVRPRVNNDEWILIVKNVQVCEKNVHVGFPVVVYIPFLRHLCNKQ